MLKGGIPIGKVFGIQLRLHYSWFFIFALVTWALASGYFPQTYPNWTLTTAITAGVVTSVLFFGSVMLHELMHSRVAQATGLTVASITLFIFGGVSQMTEEPKKPRDEFWMALAGPLTSLVLGGIFWGIYFFLPTSEFVHGVSYWLGLINISLGVFNLIPGFPLDGGRVFRSIVWMATGNLMKATRIASGIGRGVGFLFIFGGVWFIFTGNWVNGLWIAFIGWFLESAASGSYRQLVLQEMLQGHIAKEIMTSDCTTVEPNLSVERLVNELILPSGRRCFPVVEGNSVIGLATLASVKAIPRDRWALTTVKQAMTAWDKMKTVNPDESLSTVLKIMAEEDVNQVPVVQEHTILGMVGRDNLISFINVRGELQT